MKFLIRYSVASILLLIIIKYLGGEGSGMVGAAFVMLATGVIIYMDVK